MPYKFCPHPGCYHYTRSTLYMNAHLRAHAAGLIPPPTPLTLKYAVRLHSAMAQQQFAALATGKVQP